MTLPASPVVLLTCGDPAGIGPEVVVRGWQSTSAHERARLRLVAAVELLAQAVRGRRGVVVPEIEAIGPDDARESTPGRILVIEPAAVAPVFAASAGGAKGAELKPGVATAAGGAAAATAVLAAATVVQSGRARALVTGPLNKAALHAAGYDTPGHTELLARAAGLADDAVSMMLWLPGVSSPAAGLGVVHVTLHEPLAHAVTRITAGAIVAAGQRLAALLGALLGRPPRIAVAALNPHGGEAGLFGDEEERIVLPAVQRLVEQGIDASGPLPADTLFLQAAAGRFDGVVALYHDQGHIPVKLLGMHRAVNITLGLPFVRTSVAHGTAYDIVGTGAADPASMLAAIDAAVRLVAGQGRSGATAFTCASVRSSSPSSAAGL